MLPNKYQIQTADSQRGSMAEVEAPAIITQSNQQGEQLLPRPTSNFFLFNILSSVCSCWCNSSMFSCSNPPKNALLHPLSEGSEDVKTLILDLDETLVHSSFSAANPHDIVIPIRFDKNDFNVYVAIRPGIQEFLARMSEIYEIVIFTASLDIVTFKQYANPLLDRIDPNRYIGGRLFRDSCVLIGGSYVKDLSYIGRDLSKVIIVDVRFKQNSPNSYSLQPENAVPILSWYDDKTDIELFKLTKALENLSSVDDVQVILGPMHHLNLTAKEFIRHLAMEQMDDSTSSASNGEKEKEKENENIYRADFNSPVSRDNKKFEFEDEEE